ncbi:MAG: holo-ACP synthase [Treponema sp.]|nr:holo-ACP synthase [Treponema sp.]
MIFGTGIDLAKVSRFEKWVKNPDMLERNFHKEELLENYREVLTQRQISSASQHYAARFAAKEAFSKALGTGIRNFSIKDVYVKNDELGKPYIMLQDSAKEVFEKLCPGSIIHLSMSHEKEFAIANVIIEK